LYRILGYYIEDLGMSLYVCFVVVVWSNSKGDRRMVLSFYLRRLMIIIIIIIYREHEKFYVSIFVY